MAENETEFVDGLIVKAPRQGAPDFVKGSLSIKREELIAWLQAKTDDWVNVDIKESRGGKWYGQVNTWKPDPEKANGGGAAAAAAPAAADAPQGAVAYPENEVNPDDIPF